MDKLKKNNNLKIKIIFFILLQIFFIFFLVVNFKTPLLGEDYALLYNGPFKDIGDYFSTIMAALEKQMSTWMVRMGNPLTIIWLSFDKSIYNIAVSFVSMIFFFLIFFYGNARKPNVNNLGDLIGFFVPASLMMFLSPSIGDLFFWCNGSLNYLWPLCILLLCAIPYRLYLSEKNINIKNPILIILYCIACFISGFTNENTPPVIITLVAALIIRDLYLKKKPPKWIVFSFISICAGCIGLVVNSTTRFRSMYYRNMFGLPEHATINELINNVLRVGYLFLKSGFAFVIIFLILSLLFIFILKSQKTENEFKYKHLFAENMFFILLTFISAAALVFAPYTELRSFTLIHTIILATISNLLVNLYEISSHKQRLGLSSISIITLLSTFLLFINIYNEYNDYYKFDTQRTCDIKSQVAAGKTTVYASKNFIENRTMNNREFYIYGNDLGQGGNFYSDYFGAKKIIWYDKIDSNIDPATINLSSESTDVNVELINGNSEQDNSSLLSDGIFNVSGWAIDKVAGNSPSKVFIKIDDKYYQARTVIREDVAKYFDNKKYKKAGFECSIPTKDIKKGKHKVTLCVISNDGEKRYEVDSGKSIEFK